MAMSTCHTGNEDNAQHANMLLHTSCKDTRRVLFWPAFAPENECRADRGWS